jgi:hypothetical protein
MQLPTNQSIIIRVAGNVGNCYNYTTTNTNTRLRNNIPELLYPFIRSRTTSVSLYTMT